MTGCVAALSPFISRLSEKGRPLYRLLKKSDSFEWTNEAHATFDDLKHLLSTPPILATPAEKEPLLLYITATNYVVRVVLVVERAEEGRVEKVRQPIYYVSEVLFESKQWYPHYQKPVYDVFLDQESCSTTSKPTQSRWSAAPPLLDIICNRDATGRVAKWAIELAAHEINYEP